MLLKINFFYPEWKILTGTAGIYPDQMVKNSSIHSLLTEG
jgi:hypothetical protein